MSKRMFVLAFMWIVVGAGYAIHLLATKAWRGAIPLSLIVVVVGYLTWRALSGSR